MRLIGKEGAGRELWGGDDEKWVAAVGKVGDREGCTSGRREGYSQRRWNALAFEGRKEE
jgi:hypothetical protein